MYRSYGRSLDFYTPGVNSTKFSSVMLPLFSQFSLPNLDHTINICVLFFVQIIHVHSKRKKRKKIRAIYMCQQKDSALENHV